MIDKQTQDQVWAVLPKEFRERVKEYLGQRGWGMMASDLLQRLFGSHNLTSDAEPEEMISLEKGKVQFMFDGLDDTPVRCEFDRGYKTGKEFILHGLFGSKCLPDELEQTSVKVDEPASEKAEPTEPKSDDMEEKELNLCEILKEGAKVYSPLFRDGEVTNVYPNYFEVTWTDRNGSATWDFQKDGSRYIGLPIIFPSHEAYLKYPLDARAAWMEWKQANKPNYEIEGPLQIFEDGALVDEIDLPEIKFKSLDIACQAAEAVKATLEQFHKDHAD